MDWNNPFEYTERKGFIASIKQYSARLFDFLKQYKLFVLILFVIVASGIIIYKASIVSSLSYTWVQTDWSGGESAEYPRHDNYQTGWTKWYSNIGNLKTDTAGQITLNTSTYIATSSVALPTAREETVAIYDATTTKLYVIGGYNYDGNGDPQFLNSIIQYDPVTEAATTTGIGTLSVALRGHSADISDTDGNIYIFGGFTGSVFNTNIYTFDPAQPASSTVDTGYDLPGYREYGPAVYAPNVSKFYIFGGYYLDGSSTAQYLSSIIEFNPTTGNVATTSLGLPVHLKGASAEYWPDDGKIYIFGGYDSDLGDYTNKIYVFNPQSPNSGASELSGITLPTKRAYTSASYYSSLGVGSIKKILIFGGYYSSDATSTPVYLDTVVNFDVSSATAQTEIFDKTLRGTSAAFSSSDNTIYVFGGYSASVSDFSSTIYKYQLYTADPLYSSPFHTTDLTTVLASFVWDESLNTDTDILFQIRTATNDDNDTPLDFIDDTPDTWTDWCGPDNGGAGCATTTYFTEPSGSQIDAMLTDGVGDIWVQYRVYIVTDSLNNTPTLQEVRVNYAINTAPTVSSASASQGADGIVSATYTLADNEEATSTVYLLYDIGLTLTSEQTISATSVTLTGDNATYINSTGTIQIEDEMMTYTNKVGNVLSGITRSANNTLFYKKAHSAAQTVWIKANSVTGAVGETATGTDKLIYWSAKTDIDGLWASNNIVKTRVVANDGNAARQVGSNDSSTFEFDTKNPVVGTTPAGNTGIDINSNATTTIFGTEKTNVLSNTINLSCTDNTALQISLSNDNVSYSEYQAYASSTAWSLDAFCAENEYGCEKTVYVKFKDSYNNEIGPYHDHVTLDNNAPAIPGNMYIQDVSNPVTFEYRIFTTWDKATESDWIRYELYRSVNGIDFNAYATITDINLNYKLDVSLASSTTYYYKVRSVDDIINNSDYSSLVSQTAGGNPQDNISPTISSVTNNTPTINSVTVTWTTDEIASSNVYYSTTSTVPDGSPGQGVSGYSLSHSVTLKGLDSNTPYYYKARSCDASDNCSTSLIYNFLTAAPDTGVPDIDDIASSDLKEHAATISWTTDEAADSFIEFSKTPSFVTGTLQGNFEFLTSHSITLAGLDSGSTYYYKVRSADSSGNVGISGENNFATATSSADVTPPSITDVSSGSLLYNTATITWTTNENSSSFVEFGLNTGYGRIYGQNDSVTSHTVNLPHDLIPATTYHFRVRSKDAANNEGISSDYNFTTAANPNDVTAPVISSIDIGDPGKDQITITWTTNEEADSYIGYSQATTTYTSEQGIPTMTTSHSVTLVGLVPNTTYYARVKSTDPSGNIAINNNSGNGYSFTTLASSSNPPTIYENSIQFSNVTHNTATISWTTDIAATSFVEYGLNTAYGLSQGSFTLATSHSVTLSNLLSDATYHFRVRSANSEGVEAVSQNYTFTTDTAPDITPPVISSVQAINITLISANITWDTNEDSNSIIEYGTSTGALIYLAGDEGTYVTDHSVALNNLAGNTTYYYQVKSRDRTGNLTTDTNSGAYYSFTTVADITPPEISSVTVATADRNSATITWHTDEDATSQATYSLYEDMSGSTSTTLVTDLRQDHSVLISSLNASTTYYYYVSSKDASNNLASSTVGSFNTAFAKDDVTAPVISSVATSSITLTGATITWTTNENSDSIVDYGTTISLGSLEGNTSDATITHSVSLTGLSPNTLYYFQVRSQDSSGNTATDNNGGSYYTFTTTADTTPPVISLVDHPVVDRNSATIIWTTNEAATSQVEYSTSSDLSGSSSTTLITDLTLQHSVVISSLTANTKYYYRVKSKDAANNPATSSIYNFTTSTSKEDQTAPLINSVATSSITLTSAVITWTTNELSNTIIDYGTTNALGLMAGNIDDATTSHRVSLAGLSSDTLYYFQVRSQDSSGNTATDNNDGDYYTFTTTADTTSPVISLVDHPVVDRNSATIIWTTNEAATSQVEYSLLENMSGSTSTTIVTDLRTEHSVILSSLSSNTKYYYRVKSKDAANNPATSSIYNFTTAQAKADSTAPTISSVATSSITLTGATITWTTNESSDSIVDYGLTTGLGSMTGNVDDATTSHIVSLTGLTSDTTYYFQVRSADASGNRGTNNNGGAYYIFTTTADSTAPTISSVEASVVDRNSATITWTTDEAATSQVEYSLLENMSGSTSTTLITDLTLQHSVVISSLTANTKYYYRVKSKDAANNPATSSIYNFTTSTAKDDVAAPVISSVATSSISLTGATITWTTNENSDSIVDYGTTIALGSLGGNTSDSTTAHSVSLTGLSSNTTYYFQVRSQDSSGNTATDNNDGDYYTFTTTADSTPPTISSVEASVVDRNSATITWTTNEAATSQVEYSLLENMSGSSSTSLVTDLRTAHSVVISGLTAGTKYYYRVKSKDASNNEAISIIYNFTTATANQDTHAPVISSVATSSITNTSAVVAWITDENANSIVDYGTTISLGLMAGNVDAATTNHSVSLTGLTQGTTYYFQVRSQDASGNSIPDNNNGDYYTFTTTADSAAPVISNVNIPLITSSSAIVVWTTDEDSTSQVEYGTDNTFGSETIEDTTLTKIHAVTITSLSAQTVYYVKAVSKDGRGNEGTNDNGGQGYVLRTTSASTVVIIGGGGGGASAANIDIDPPLISGIKIAEARVDTAKVAWNTNENASKLVEYGFSNDYGYIAGSYEIGEKSHEVGLQELFPSTTYHYRVISLDSKGNISRSLDDTFKTQQGIGGPKNQQEVVNTVLGMIEQISNPYDITQVSKAIKSAAAKKMTAPIIAGELPRVEPYEDSARITWITDKESDSIVAYAVEEEYKENAQEPYKNIIGNADESVTFHSVDLTSLKPSTMYHLQVRSKMSIGPEAKSQDITFYTKSVRIEIANFRISKIEEDKVTFSFDTNVAASAEIQYTNLANNKVMSQVEESLVKRHSIVLESLQQDVTYSAIAICKDEYSNEAKSDRVQFTTGKDNISPEITQVRANSTLYPGKDIKIQTIVTWLTNEQSTSQVFWQEGTAQNTQAASSPKDSSMVIKHVAVLTKFKPSTVYKFWVESEDLFGNKAKSREFTILTPKQTETVVEIIIKNFEDIFGWTKKLQ